MVDEIQDVLREPSHVAGETEGQMVQVVRLVPDQDSFAQLISHPLVVRDGCEMILCADEERCGDVQLGKRHVRWCHLPILLHVLCGAIVESPPNVCGLSTLHEEGYFFVSTSCRVVLHEDGQPAHVVDLIITASRFV